MRLTVFHWISAFVLSIILHLAGFYAFYYNVDTDGALEQGSGGFEVAISLQAAAAGSDQSLESKQDLPEEIEGPAKDVAEDTVTVPEEQPIISENEKPVEPVAKEIEATPQPTENDLPAIEELEQAEANPVLLPLDEKVIEDVPPPEPMQELAKMEQAPVPLPKVRPPELRPIKQPEVKPKQSISKKPLAKEMPPKESVDLPEVAKSQTTSLKTEDQEGVSVKPQVKQGAAPTSEMADRSDTSNNVGGGKIVGRATPTYVTHLREWLERHKTYPKKAKRRRHQGVVLLAFTINRHGEVMAYQIEKSSGIESLDKATEKMLLSASPLPPFPQELEGDVLKFVLPVEFSLSN